MILCFVRCAAFTLTLLMPALAQAVLINWDGNQSVDGNFDGTFGVANSWNPDQVPAVGDMANFNANASYIVTFDQNESVDDLRVVDGDVTFLSDSAAVRTLDISTGLANANISGGKLTVGSKANPVVLDVRDVINIGTNIAGTGEVIVSGSNSQLNGGSFVHAVGSGGNIGILTITSIATANYGGSLNVGVSAFATSNGTVEVEDGGTLNTGIINIATSSNSTSGTGTVSVVNPTSSINQTLANSTLTIGSSVGGAGTLNIQDAGTFTTSTGTTTVNATGVINITGGGTLTGNGAATIEGMAIATGTGSTWNSNSGLTLGNTGQGTLNVEAGAQVSTVFGLLGFSGGSTGTATVTGVGSSWSTEDSLFVGFSGNGSLNVANGGVVTTENGTIAQSNGTNSSATVTGIDSEWNNAQTLTVGLSGQANLTIEAGGLVTSHDSFIANRNSVSSATVTGSGSTWSNSDRLIVGQVGQGSLLIQDGGQVDNVNGIIGDLPSAVGSVEVTGEGSTWNTNGNLNVGVSGQATLNINSGGTVNVAGATAIRTNDMVSITSGTLNANGPITLAGGSGTLLFDGGILNASSGLDNSLNRDFDFRDGTLTVTGGAFVPVSLFPTSNYSIDGTDGADRPHLTIGTGSSMNIGDFLFIGGANHGELTINGGAQVTSNRGRIGSGAGSTGTVSVAGQNSTWTNLDSFSVGSNGTGTLTVTGGGVVSVEGDSRIGVTVGSTGSATVSGPGSTWVNSAGLFVGGNTSGAAGDGTLTITDQGLVDITGTLQIWSPGVVTLSGGTLSMDAIAIETGGTLNFNFGTLNLKDDLTITTGDLLEDVLGGSHKVSFGKTLEIDGTATLNGVMTVAGGTLTVGALVNPQLLDHRQGTLNINSQAVVVGPGGLFGNTLTLEPNATINVAQGTTNNGLITGNGQLGGTVANDNAGEIQSLSGTNLRFTGNGSSNNGQVTLSGGQVHFTQDFTNNSSGLVIGNGTLRADGGITNSGHMALSATANIIGDITNDPAGTIISAGGTTTFYDDITNNGIIRTSANSFSVYFGSYSGNGDTGTGTVIMEGDLKPGNSPGTMAFGGDLLFGPAARLEIEIGGLLAGSEYDQVVVANDVTLAGVLDVSLLEGFVPVAGDTFEILTAASVVDAFDTTNFPELTGLAWNVEYNPTSVILSLTTAVLFGDADNDLAVSGSDLLAVTNNFGNTGPADGLLLGDADDNGSVSVSGSDLLAVTNNFGATLPGSLASSPVPEPTSLAFLLGGVCLLASHRRSEPITHY